MSKESDPKHFSTSEKKALLEAIKYTISREGNFYSSDPLVGLIGKLNDIEDSKINSYNSTELADLLKVIDENVKFLIKYEYPQGLTSDFAAKSKQKILTPLNRLRTKISNEI